MKYSIMMMLVLLGCSGDNAFRKLVPIIEEINTKGCLNSYASNLEISATQEDGSCFFSYCPDYGFRGYDEKVHTIISEYIEFNGDTFKDRPRVTNTCGKKLVYCKNEEAINYIAPPHPPQGYHSEYCYFEACNKKDFEGYAKFLEFEEYLKNTPGEIKVNNSVKVCGDQTIFTEKKTIRPEVTDSDFKKSEISFILDDSGSMREEIESVKNALISLVPTLQMLKSETSLNFYKLGDIDKKYKLSAPDRNQFDRYDFHYTLPDSMGEVKFQANQPTKDIQDEINKILKDFKIGKNSNEEGFCMTLQYLQDLQISKFENKTKNIFILITDEDEHNGNKTENCRGRFQSFNKNGKDKNNFEVFTGASGEEVFTSSLDKILKELTETERKSLGWFGIFYDRLESTCSGAQSGKSYRELMKVMKSNGVDNAFGDICSDNYASLINDKLIKGFLEKITYRYPLKKHNGSLKINQVNVILKSGISKRLEPSTYKLIQNADEYFIEFKESLGKIILETQNFDIEITYRK